MATNLNTSENSNSGAPSSSAAPIIISAEQLLPKGLEKRRIARYLRKFDQFMREVKQHGQIQKVRLDGGEGMSGKTYELAAHIGVPDEVFGGRIYSKTIVKLPKTRVYATTPYAIFVLVHLIKRFVKEQNIPITTEVSYP